MQLTRSVLTSLVAISPLVPLAHAVGFARVANNCANTTYAWSVGSSVGDMQTIDSGGVYSEPFRSDPVSGGVSIKVCRTADGLFDGSPQTNFAYSLNGSLVWYDLSDVFGDAFNGSGVSTFRIRTKREFSN